MRFNLRNTQIEFPNFTFAFSQKLNIFPPMTYWNTTHFLGSSALCSGLDYGIGIVDKCLWAYNVEGAFERCLQKYFDHALSNQSLMLSARKH